MDVRIEFSNFVDFPLKCFKVFGLNPNEADFRDSRKERLQKYYYYLVITILIMLNLETCVFIQKNITQLNLLTETLPAVGYTTLALVKSLTFSMKKKEFNDIMDTLRKLFPKSREEQKVFRVKNYLKDYKFIERTFFLLVCSAGINFTVAPVIKFLLTRVWIDKLPFNNWYPFDEYNPRFYNFVFFWQFYTTIITIAPLAGLDLIFYSFITQISMHFDILCQKLDDLKSERTNLVDMVKLIKLHEILIKLSNNLEEIYSISILVNFTASSILICLVGFQLTIEINFENLTKSGIFLAASLLQVLMICYYGDKLTNAGANVANAVYKSGWEERNQKGSRNTLLLMIHKSQKPIVITAYKFSVVSLQVFTSVS